LTLLPSSVLANITFPEWTSIYSSILGQWRTQGFEKGQIWCQEPSPPAEFRVDKLKTQKMQTQSENSAYALYTAIAVNNMFV